MDEDADAEYALVSEKSWLSRYLPLNTPSHSIQPAQEDNTMNKSVTNLWNLHKSPAPSGTSTPVLMNSGTSTPVAIEEMPIEQATSAIEEQQSTSKSSNKKRTKATKESNSSKRAKSKKEYDIKDIKVLICVYSFI